MDWLFLLIVFLIVMALVANKFSSKFEGKESNVYEQQSSLLTPAERSFYGVLLQALDSETVAFSKVRVADVLKPIKGLDRSNWQTAFNKISAKHFDFVLCDVNTLAVKMVVELDDRSHQKKVRVKRDEFLESACKSAKLNLIRIKASRVYRIQEIKDQLYGVSNSENVIKSDIDNELKFIEFDLHMSVQGFAKAAVKLKEVHKRTPQVFVLVGVDDDLRGQVLMIGQSKNGAYNRWIEAGNGHKNTFFWSIGESDSYTQKNAEEYSNYLLFFAALVNQKTKLFVFDVEQDEMTTKKSELSKEYLPIWQQYNEILKSKNNYPVLTGQDRNQSIVNTIAKLGAAQQLIIAQRKLGEDSAKRLPDVMSLKLRSAKAWLS